MHAHSSPWAMSAAGCRMVYKACVVPVHLVKKVEQEETGEGEEGGREEWAELDSIR